MPARISGARSLQTPTLGNSILHNASIGSVQLWVQLNSVGSTSNVISLFRKQFSQDFQIVRPNTFSNKVRMQWLGTNGTPFSDNVLTVGTAYHLAMTWTGGAQAFYVNGTLVGSGTTAGNLATQASNRYLFLGDQVASHTDLDFTLEDPAVWSGYALTAQDVLDLRDRVKNPPDIGASSLAWYATLDGTAGADCTVGDLGLASAGTVASQDLTVISAPAPAYVSGTLTYSAPTHLARAAVCPSGLNCCFVFADANDLPTNVSAINNHPTVSKNGSSPSALANPVWGVSGSTGLPFILYPLPYLNAVAATDSVTFTTLANWATAAAGNIDAQTNADLTNLVGGRLTPLFVPGVKSMGAGYNLQRLRYYNPVPVYANAFKHAGVWFKNTGSGIAVDANGDLSGLGGGTASAVVSLCNAAGGYPGQPAGTWTLAWDGDGSATLATAGGGNSVTLITGTNPSTWNVTRAPGQYWVSLEVTVSSLGTTGVKNIRVYPPGVNTDGSQKWHPNFLSKLTGAKSLRFMEVLETNTSGVVNYSDWMPATRATYGAPRTVAALDILEVGPSPYTVQDGRAAVEVRTTGNHGLSVGQIVYFPITGSATYTLSDSSVHTLDNYTLAVVEVNTTDRFVVAHFTGTTGITLGVVAQPYSGTVDPSLNAGLPLADVVDLCNSVGCDLWMNIPSGLTDAGISSTADYLAANLTTGRKCRVEYLNETWNGSFQALDFTYARAYRDGTLSSSSYTRQHQWYAKQSSHVHGLFATSFTSAGRLADLVRVVGGQYATNTPLSESLVFAAAQGYLVDEGAVATYWEDAANDATWKSTYGATLGAWTVEQIHDLTELWVQYGSIGTRLTALNTVVTTSYPSGKLSLYEGGPQAVYSTGGGGYDASVLSRQWGRHPRVPYSYLYLLQLFNDAGCGVWCHFDLGDTTGTGYVATDANWPAYFAWGQVAGAGDGSDGRFDNRTDFTNLDQLVSVIGHAIDLWNGTDDGTALPAPARVLLSAGRPLLFHGAPAQARQGVP